MKNCKSVGDLDRILKEAWASDGAENDDFTWKVPKGWDKYDLAWLALNFNAFLVLLFDLIEGVHSICWQQVVRRCTEVKQKLI